MSIFSYSPIDRQSEIRADTSLIRDYLQSDKSRIMLWFEGNLITRENNFYFLFEELQQPEKQLVDVIYLGHREGCYYFSSQLNQQYAQFDCFKLLNLRSASLTVNDYHLGLLYYSQGLLNWHLNHQYCGSCGSDTRAIHSGHVRQCNNSDCNQEHYPSINPAVIFMIINKTQVEPKILLARQSSWDDCRYSVIAGFVESGETLEDAVKREAYEETGLSVDNIHYADSQPWPFPGSIMVGFNCETSQQDITLIDQELEKASWFSADEIESKCKSGDLKMPFTASIAWHLIDRWFIQQKGYSLSLNYTWCDESS